MFSRAVAVTAMFLASVAIGFGIVEHQDASRTSTQLARTSAQVRQLGTRVGALNTQVGNLSTSVAGISQPNDPFSAYTDICNTTATNSNTDETQTYYYPCTNNAQTIPQPGN